MKPIRPLIVVFALLCGALPGCLTESPQRGVVAVVNGRPIHLRLVEARHDAGGLNVIARNPSVDLLQQQYGAILAELIVQELVVQELERLGLSVTDEDMAPPMEVIRGDYGDEIFHEALSEEYVDEKTWRALFRYTAAMSRFNERVLRPKIRLTEAEVETYYVEHAAEFLAPSRLSLLVLTGSSQKAVTEARDRALAGGWGKSLRDHQGVWSQRVDIRPSHVSDIWQEEIGKLTVGKGTRIRETNEVFQCLILEKRLPARRLSLVDAYLQIEQVLVEKKMEELFADWLEAAMTRASISVAAQLLPQDRSKGKIVPDQEADPRNSEPILDSSE
jgi:hypothetical protein